MPILRHLFAPLQIGAVTVPNRILQTSHAKGYEEQVYGDPLEGGSYALPSERNAHYHAERAKGGAGLLIAEYHMVHPTSTGGIHGLAHAYRPEIVPRYQMIADTVHSQGTGTKIFGQLCHVGMHTAGDLIDHYHEVWAPSSIAGLGVEAVPKEMEKRDIVEVVEGFARSAAHVKRGGLDGVEIHAAHSYLLAEFISPTANKRTDEYGGSLENRCRIVLEVIEAVRAAVGSDFPLGLRLSADEFAPGGIEAYDAVEIARLLTAEGNLDWLDVSAGAYWSPAPIISAPMSFPPGFIVHLASAIKQVVEIPVFCVGRITDPALAEKILQDGHADMVGMTRALLADPELPNKAREGRLEDIRYCIGCMQACVGRLRANLPISCIHNPAAGREKYLGIGTLEPAATRKRVVVVGGGPAGLKTAEIAAKRGHDVTVLERRQEPGGQIRLAARTPGRAEFEEVIRYLMVQLRRLEVAVRTGIEATAKVVLAERPDAIVVATGGRIRRTLFQPGLLAEVTVPGVDHLERVVSVTAVLEEDVPVGDRVVVVDQDGHWRSIGVAQHLASLGRQVTIVTSAPSVGSRLDISDRMVVLPLLAKSDIEIITSAQVASVEGGVVQGKRERGGGSLRLEGIDTIVWATPDEPNDSLYFELEGRVPELHRVGDAVAPRSVEYAIWDGEIIGRKL